MGRTTAGLLLAVVMGAVIVTVDILIFRHHVLARLAANVGIVLLGVAFYLRFVHRR